MMHAPPQPDQMIFSAAENDGQWDIDFSLALYNRTGKFFIGQKLLEVHPHRFRKIYYWRMPMERPPDRILSRLIGKLEELEHRARVLGVGKKFPVGRTASRMVHLDPLTVLHRDLAPDDLVLCHDLGPITHPELFSGPVVQSYRCAYDLIAKRRPAMVFVSKASAHSFMESFGEPRCGTVVYPPIRHEVTWGGEEPIAGIDGTFLLTVGSIGQRKNQLTAIKAFASSGLAARGVQYLLCGSREPGAEEVARLARETDGVLLVDYISDACLRWAYRRACGFVLPSLLEGFGMPVSEAMMHGLRPVVSRGSVLEEVAGACGISVDPLDQGEIACAMKRCVVEYGRAATSDAASMQAQLAKFSESNFREGWRNALSR